MQEKYITLQRILKSDKDKIDSIEKLESKLDKILGNKKEQEKEKTKKKNKGVIL